MYTSIFVDLFSHFGKEKKEEEHCSVDLRRPLTERISSPPFRSTRTIYAMIAAVIPIRCWVGPRQNMSYLGTTLPFSFFCRLQPSITAVRPLHSTILVHQPIEGSLVCPPIGRNVPHRPVPPIGVSTGGTRPQKISTRNPQRRQAMHA